MFTKYFYPAGSGILVGGLAVCSHAATVTPIDQFNFEVVLDRASGESAELQIPLTPLSGSGVLDVFFLQDLTSSFSNDLPVIRGVVNDTSAAGLFPTLDRFADDVVTGVGTFQDKPFGSFGPSSYNLYETVSPLSRSIDGLRDAYQGATTLGGNTFPEGSLEALQQVGLRVSEVGWRDGARRVAVVVTDAAFHQAGDASFLPANNGDTILDGTPAGSGEDFPSVAQARLAIEQADVTPVFVVTREHLETYETLVADLGRGTVVELESDSSNLAAAVTEGLDGISGIVELSVLSIDSPTLGAEVEPGLFEDVASGETVTFDVSVLQTVDDEPGIPGRIVLASNGFGTFNIDVSFSDGPTVDPPVIDTPRGDPSICVPTPSAGAAGFGLLALVGRRRNKSEVV